MAFKNVEAMRAYKAANAERIREINRAYRERNRERLAARERESAPARKAAMSPERLEAVRIRRREQARARRLQKDARPIRKYEPQEPDLPTIQIRISADQAPAVQRPAGLPAWIPLGGDL